ncbi:hypothetical protein [Hymenobacter latericus]|uniref:hypothetical protein n=1 Tax=Hymenobacter sp. YIM 151858-1 TaxID=2987688 RepID=UPI002227D0F5|nr:hypothetical protein [Hymenobacter sp. YIM 151858-1]UYZ60134.1 hypothetical protein OIS50_04860 [Hymenobacter sp. YIM 151858-1]
MAVNQFFKDARGVFNIFTVIALLAGLTVVGLPWCIVLQGYPNPERIDTLAYANFFLVLAASVGDTLLSLIMERGFWQARKAPENVNVQTGEHPVNNQLPDDEA